MVTVSPKLKPELVPEPLWRLSAYRILSRSQWEKIRASILGEQGNRCSVCGLTQHKGMICHEIWDYDERQLLATLTGLAILCPQCSNIHHIGLARVQGVAEEALKHMIHVNGMSLKDATAVVKQSFRDWRRRSQHRWGVAVSKELLSRFPQLRVLEGVSSSPHEGSKRVRTNP